MHYTLRFMGASCVGDRLTLWSVLRGDCGVLLFVLFSRLGSLVLQDVLASCNMNVQESATPMRGLICSCETVAKWTCCNQCGERDRRGLQPAAKRGLTCLETTGQETQDSSVVTDMATTHSPGLQPAAGNACIETHGTSTKARATARTSKARSTDRWLTS